MSGQRSADDEGTAESVAAGCVLRETRSTRSSNNHGGGANHNLAARDGLAVFTWGRGEDGQLGLGDTADQDEPTYASIRTKLPVPASEGLAVFVQRERRAMDCCLKISVSHFISFFHHYSPFQVDALRGVGVRQIACGSGHTVVLTTDGEGGSNPPPLYLVVSVGSITFSTYLFVRSFRYHCIITVYTWGRGDDGRLGHGDNGWKYVPRICQSLAGQVVTQVTCGSYHTAAVTGNGDLWTWGGGMYGKRTFFVSCGMRLDFVLWLARQSNFSPL